MVTWGRGERGATGDHGQIGPIGPRGLRARRSWLPAIAIAAFALIQVFGFAFARLEGERAIDAAKREVEAEAAHRDRVLAAEAERADAAICTIAASNRQRSVTLIQGFIGLVMNAAPPVTEEQAESRATVLAELERQLADARTPFPPPCDTTSI